MTDVNDTVVDAVTDNVIAEIEKKAKVKGGKPGRKPMLSNEKEIIRVLTSIYIKDAENIPSRPIMIKLMDMGYLATQDVKSGTRGRPAKEYFLTTEGLELIGEGVEEETASEEIEAEAEESENRELVTE